MVWLRLASRGTSSCRSGSPKKNWFVGDGLRTHEFSGLRGQLLEGRRGTVGVPVLCPTPLAVVDCVGTTPVILYIGTTYS